jgi:hypothetical protein
MASTTDNSTSDTHTIATSGCPNFWIPTGFDYKPPRWRWRKFSPLTKYELSYLQFLAEILSKPQWWIKKDDPEIRAKWEKEMRKPLFYSTSPVDGEFSIDGDCKSRFHLRGLFCTFRNHFIVHVNVISIYSV